MDNNTTRFWKDNVTETLNSDIIPWFSQALLVSLLCGITGVFGVFGNILVIAAIDNGRRLKTNYYRLVFHLALCDVILLSGGSVLFTMFPWLDVSSLTLQKYSCRFLMPFFSWLFSCEIGFMSIIAFLRHQVVTQPLRPQLSRRKVTHIIFGVYTFILLFEIPHFLSMKFGRTRCVESFFVNRYYQIYFWTRQMLLYFLPMALLVVLYAKMSRSLFLHQRHLKETLTSTARNDLQNNNREFTRLLMPRLARNTQIVLVGIIIVVQYSIAILPNLILNLPFVKDTEETSIHFGWSLPVYFLGSCSLNPIIYGLGDKTLRSRYKSSLLKITLLCKIIKRSGHGQELAQVYNTTHVMHQTI